MSRKAFFCSLFLFIILSLFLHPPPPFYLHLLRSNKNNLDKRECEKKRWRKKDEPIRIISMRWKIMMILNLLSSSIHSAINLMPHCAICHAQMLLLRLKYQFQGCLMVSYGSGRKKKGQKRTLKLN